MNGLGLPARYKLLALLSCVLTGLVGCAYGYAVLNADLPLDSTGADSYDDTTCHDHWPLIEVRAEAMVTAIARGQWQVDYPAERMLQNSVAHLTARLRCPQAEDVDIVLEVTPGRLYVGSFGIGPGQIAGADFDLSVTVLDRAMGRTVDWYIMPWSRFSREPVRTGLASRGKMLQVLEPDMTALAYEAMILALEMALECFRELQGLPILRPDIFADSDYQCLPPGPERRRQTLAERINEQVRQRQ